MVLEYPSIDPVAMEIGPLFGIGPVPIRWYSLSYLAGILLGWRYIIWLNNRSKSNITRQHIDDFLIWATLGIVLGGRVGYMLFYQPAILFHDPIAAFKVWQGGMSFHGGLLGMALVIFLFAWRNKISVFRLGDLIACAAPIGLFFGRVANFINGELYGRVTTSSLGMVFPNGGELPRHPSQLYEAFFEGIVLFLLLFYLAAYRKSLSRPGVLSGVFLAGYSLARIFAEFFRQPDVHLGFIIENMVIIENITMGQVLSLPMFLFGVWLVYDRNIYHSKAKD